jgi:hypothetical protein
MDEEKLVELPKEDENSNSNDEIAHLKRNHEEQLLKLQDQLSKSQKDLKRLREHLIESEKQHSLQVEELEQQLLDAQQQENTNGELSQRLELYQVAWVVFR